MNKYKESVISHPLPPGTAILICVVGTEQGQEIPITKHQIKFGRFSDCDVTIPTELVSRYHAILSYENGQYILYDQNSTNGTWVNGQRIMECHVEPNDRIQIGPNVFVLRFSKETPKSSDRQITPTPTPQGLKSEEHLSGLYTRNLTDYEMLDKWSGGMAVVYKARSITGQIVAIKLLSSQDPYIKDKFIREIEVGKTLNHPHIVQVLGGGQHEGKWFMIMEFMEGETLSDRIQVGLPSPLDFTIQLVGQICSALGYAHQRGIYHRDIKPANILFDGNNSAKLGDFGIARIAQAVTMTAHGAVIGTPKYMSPEQGTGQKIDHRSDIYSLGIVLYQMLTGYAPFNHKDALYLIGCHIKEMPRPPHEINPNVPPQLEQIALKALEKDPANRFQHADEMAHALGYKSNKRAKTTIVSMMLTTTNNVIFRLGEDRLILGRNNVNVEDTEISRMHAMVVYQRGRWWLEDNNSTNGTFVNRRRIFEPVMLRPDDEIRIGQTFVYVRLG
jgi:serine/threonine protein kinase